MRRLIRYMLFACALAVIVGCFLPERITVLAMAAITALILAVAWRLFQPKKLDPNSKEYAIMLYHNGMISMDELCIAFAKHPEWDKENNVSKRS